MAIKDMIRTERSTGEAGAIYSTKLELSSGISDIYLLPEQKIYAVGIITENGILYFTIDSPDIIEKTEETWLEWEESTQVNFAITAFKFAHSIETAKCTITVKTENY